MTLGNAEKQARYRERHLGAHGGKVRLQTYVSASTKAQLVRLARYRHCSLTKVIEDLVADADSTIVHKLPAQQRRT
jgi:hypothetical protein